MSKKLWDLFGNGKKAVDAQAKEAMNNEIRAVGGVLHFKVEKFEDGWTAECQEIDGIITGGSNPNPSEQEMQKNIQESIHTAFNVECIEDKPVLNSDNVGAIYKVESHVVAA